MQNGVLSCQSNKEAKLQIPRARLVNTEVELPILQIAIMMAI